MLIGYARTSTLEQVAGLEAQLRDLKEYGCEKIYTEQVSSVAQFEREMMLERQREGIAKAKADGKYKGRKPTARAKTDMVKLALDKGISKAQICRDLDISKTSLYRIIGELR